MGNDGKEGMTIPSAEHIEVEQAGDIHEEAGISPEQQLQQENTDLTVEIQRTETQSRAMESERPAIKPSIVSYFQEMGPEECLARLKKMSQKGIEVVVGHIKRGNLPMVVHLMEMFSPDNLDDTTVPQDINDRQAWKTHTDKYFAETMRKFGIAVRHDTMSAKNDSARWGRLWKMLDIEPETESEEQMRDAEEPIVIDEAASFEETAKIQSTESNAILEARIAQLPEEGARNFYKSIIQNPETMKILFGDISIVEKTDAELIKDYHLLADEMRKKRG